MIVVLPRLAAWDVGWYSRLQSRKPRGSREKGRRFDVVPQRAPDHPL